VTTTGSAAPSRSRPWSVARGALPWAPLAALVPGGLTVFLAFESGGYFPGATALATLAIALLLLVRVLLADDPFAGLGVPLAVAAGALMLFAAWTLLSASWSDSSSRAMVEFDQVVLYLLALVTFGSFARDAGMADAAGFGRWLLRGVAVAMVAICTAALITKTLPNVWSAPPAVGRERLAYPIGYWNALGLTASLALVLCLHLASSAREPRVVRVVAAAACPVVGATLLFTFSRGPMAAGAVGLLAYAILGRPRLLLTGLLATVPATAAAIVIAYRADLLAKFVPGKGQQFSDAALVQGHHVARDVALCAAGAALVRGVGAFTVDRPLERIRLSRGMRRGLAAAAAALALAGVAVGVAAATRGDWLDRQYQRLVHDPVLQTGDYRDRLFNPGLSRTDRWDVARHAFADEPLIGHGAGTYQLLWERSRPNTSPTSHAHSLYLEVPAELGVVGAALLAVVLLTIVGGLAVRLRGNARSLHAAMLAAVLTWMIHAGVDWDWEIPSVTLWLFAVGGAALAAPVAGRRAARLGWPLRLGLAAGILVLAITPARLAVSQLRLVDSVDQREAGRCGAAARSADKSISILGNRPEPFEIIGYCQARAGSGDGGIAAMKAAVKRDPHNWEFHYELALVRAAAGRDPRQEARLAAELNPLEPRARLALRRFRSDHPRSWKRAARRLGLSRR
jgi:O-antigen ligase/polysaccharide polymerase Wzy-like membrane protein